VEEKMIGRLRGVLLAKQPPYLMIEVQGVGYDLEASLSTFYRLPEVGSEVSLYTHLVIREDSHTLYGFAALAERTLFRTLIKVSGIGAKLALLILSGMNVETFARCIQESDTAALTRLPGIGKKTAERLIVEMGDRIAALDLGFGLVADGERRLTPGVTGSVDDAISALVSLGYKLPDAVRMVKALDTQGLNSEDIIRRALQATLHR
jgi:Holliday junction DNA helicase RuvA